MNSGVLSFLFPTTADFAKYVPGISPETSLDEYNASAVAARKQIVNIVTDKIFQLLLKSDDAESKDALAMAWANCTMYRQLIFDIVRHRQSDTDIYKYEMENMQRMYQDNYYNAMDTLISLCSQKDEWSQTPMSKQLSQLPIASCEEFNMLYPIDNSYLFFFRVIPYQAEIFEMYSRYLTDFADELNLIKYKRAIAKMTVSLALRMFDLTEFPATIRNVFSDNKIMRTGINEHSQVEAQADLLMAAGQEVMKQLDQLIQSEGKTNVDTSTSYNKPDDKIFFLP